MIELKEGDTVVRFWVASLVEKVVLRRGDWMAVLYKHADGSTELMYRFRYHGGPGFDDDDESSWYRITNEDRDEARLSDGIRLVLKSPGFENVHEREVNGSVQKMFALLMDIPGWKIRMTRLDGEPLSEQSSGGRRA